ncbi:hypothetical protein Q8A67_000058 [Cirrhinus molitorella]|uniref:Uncharacterized protein n=1 Tax=Cirrhinus molitorella TaxID=172907 RepID=A0AA88TYF1_9TELE|nr:hypothetical protein Q8A67_000058 [Cirrhinus molitorella]
MSAAAKEDSVWIGFMDIVPVIGTLKEAVELVLAVYEGNKAVIQEKEKAVENIVKESLKKHVKPVKLGLTVSDSPNIQKKKLTSPDKPAAAAAEFSGLGNVREVRKEMIVEHVGKGSKRGTKQQTADKQRERQKRAEDIKAIKKDMLEKIHIINPNFNQELEEQLKRSQRGEHVFNNDILKFHFKVLTEFIQSHHIDNLQGYNQQTMDELGRHPLSQNTAEEIQTHMVVDFDEDEFYVNANGVVYGVYCRALREALLDVLRNINPDDVTEEERRRVNFVIDNMNNLQIYVDEFAKDKWIANRVDRQARFERPVHRGRLEKQSRQLSAPLRRGGVPPARDVPSR